MNNKYSVDYEKKTVRQLPDMEKPELKYFESPSLYTQMVRLYEGIKMGKPVYPCPTMPDSWRERETVELDKDFKIRQQWYDTKNKIWVDYFNVEERYVRSLNADTRQIAIPIAEVKQQSSWPVDFSNLKLGQRVYHKDIYDGKEVMEIIGIRKTEVELQGDYSGGTHAVYQSCWMDIEGVILPKKVCSNKVDGNCPLHNLFCVWPKCEEVEI